MAEDWVNELAPRIDALDGQDLQRLIEMVVRRYARLILDETGEVLQPFPSGSDISATESLVVAGQILRAAEVTSFELAAILNI